ncbi:DinB family protein [Pedobacter aquae]|uniref:DinB family protein n=1 Tax=Pedobacter aquae TaxID=2605747 RepID=A0A5C0VLU0_9SPHI|nr:DinB family protein [Pedobacter aquae]QEK52621.1 DinB family protein [Pedobacter aquae]
MYQPFSNEYAPYYEGYIKLVSGQNILRKLKNQLNEVDDFLAEIPAEKHDYAYADGKWTIKEVVAHLIDTERVMAYRAMRFSRNDFTPLPGFDQDFYMQNIDVSKRSFNDLVDELLIMRQANLYFFKSLTEEDYKKKGVASEREVSVGALLFIMAGHIEHHFRVLKEKYLK